MVGSCCRGGGIRTPDPREGMPVFKTGAINRSATPLFATLTVASATDFKECKTKALFGN